MTTENNKELHRNEILLRIKAGDGVSVDTMIEIYAFPDEEILSIVNDLESEGLISVDLLRRCTPAPITEEDNDDEIDSVAYINQWFRNLNTTQLIQIYPSLAEENIEDVQAFIEKCQKIFDTYDLETKVETYNHFQFVFSKQTESTTLGWRNAFLKGPEDLSKKIKSLAQRVWDLYADKCGQVLFDQDSDEDDEELYEIRFNPETGHADRFNLQTNQFEMLFNDDIYDDLIVGMAEEIITGGGYDLENE